MGDDFLHNQLIKLGDMMGDGLHHEADGRWIEKEYRKVLKQLDPDIFKDMRKRKADAMDVRVAALVAAEKCPCGGVLEQTRKGAKVVKCVACNKKWQLVSKRKGKINQG